MALPKEMSSSAGLEEDPRVTFHHLQIMRSAGHVSGSICVIYNHEKRAVELKDWGYLVRIGRTQFKLTDKGKILIGRMPTESIPA